MTTLTEATHTGEFLASEAPGYQSREKVIVLEGQNLKAGHLISIVAGNKTATQGFAGTGNGVLTLDVTAPVKSNAKLGAYKATCITAASDAATFRVEDPDGNVLGDVALGATFDDDIKFVIADGATDFTVGATFTITVALGTTKVRELNLSGVDGTEIPYGLLWAAVDATDADAAGAAIVRNTEVHESFVTWPSGVTTAQKDIIKERLAAKGFIFR